jgi:hypothetical protein
MDFFKNLNDKELVQSYADLIAELKNRKIIHSRNIIGDLGEYLAIQHYNSTPGLPKLQAAPTGTQNVDALSRKGDRYTIKSTTGNLTGVFYGLPPKDSTQNPDKIFEYVIIVMLNDDYTLNRILELDWSLFLKLKRWHKTMRAWNLSINKELLAAAKNVYP